MDQNASSSSGRLFFAVLPDADTAARIYRLAHVLKCAHKFDRKPIEPQLLHVSLFFLGEPSEQIVRIAREAAAEVRMQPFQLWFDRSASFRGRLAVGRLSSLAMRASSGCGRFVGRLAPRWRKRFEAFGEAGFYAARHSPVCGPQRRGTPDRADRLDRQTSSCSSIACMVTSIWPDGRYADAMRRQPLERACVSSSRELKKCVGPAAWSAAGSA